MLGAGLTREHDQLLRANPLGIDVDDDLQPDLVEPRQTEIGDLDRLALDRREDDAGCRENPRSPVAGHIDLASSQH